MSQSKTKTSATAAAAIVLVSALAGWKANEGLRLEPHIPVKGDVPTIGYGATFYEDGTAVKLTDPPITRERADQIALFHIQDVFAKCVVSSLGNTMVSPIELEVAIDFAGQYGCAAWSASSILRQMKAGQYVAACNAYLGYRFMTNASKLGPQWEAYTSGGRTRYRFDCSTPGNKTCRGVWTRQLERQSKCLDAQENP